MRIDMHCHTREGSVDGLVSIFDTVKILKSKGYDGMVVTDHNSYAGYEVLERRGLPEDFVVIKGIEYDTLDGGHCIIILPDGESNTIFMCRGLRLVETIDIVHSLGGIIGPAHPFDYFKCGLCNNKKWLKSVEYLHSFDFIEGFNACGRLSSNFLAKALANYLKIPTTGGSDSHRMLSVGLASTDIPYNITCANDLIAAFNTLSYIDIISDGVQFSNACMIKNRPWYALSLLWYSWLNHLLGYMHQPILKKRREAIVY